MIKFLSAKLYQLVFVLFLLQVSSIAKADLPLENSLPLLKTIGIKEGLQNSPINRIIKDKNGIIWTVSISGVFYYDGFQVKALKSQLIEGGVDTVQNSYSGEGIYLGTEHGLYYFDLATLAVRKVSFTGNDDKSQKLHINSIIDTEKFIFVGTMFGVYRYDKRNESIMFFQPPVSVKSKEVRTIALVDNSIIAGYAPSKNEKETVKGGIIQFGFDGRVIKHLVPNKVVASWRFLLSPDKKSLWVASTSAGLFEIDLDKNIVKREYGLETKTKEQIVFLDIQFVGDTLFAADFYGGLAKVTEQGLVTFNKTRFFPEELPNNSVRALFYDKGQSLLYVGHQSEGISIVDMSSNGYQYFTKSANNFPDNHIWAVQKIANNSIAIGVYGKGLRLIDPSSSKTIDLNVNGKLKAANNVKKILRLSDDELLIGTLGSGVIKYNIPRNEVSQFAAEKMVVTDIIADGEYFWIATLGGLLKIDSSGKVTETVTNANKFGSLRLFSLEQTEQYILAGGVSGLFFVDKQTLMVEKITGCSANIAHIIKLPNYRYAAATDAGICVFASEPKLVEAKYGSFGITSVLYQKESNEIWGFGENMLRVSLIDKKLQIYSKQFTHFNADKEGTAINFNGKFVIGSIDGLVVIDPASITKSEFIPTILISNFTVGNTLYSKGFSRTLPPIELPYDQNSLSFDIQIPAFRNENIQIFYKLEHSNSTASWQELVDTRRLNLSYLSHGQYSLDIKAVNDSDQSSSELSMSLTILPPWWQSNVAYLLYLIAVTVLLTMMYQFKMRKNKRVQLQLIQVVKDRTKQLNDALAAKETLFENVSHELKTPLTLILGRSEQLLKRSDLNETIQQEIQHIGNSADRLYQLVNQLLQLAEVRHKTQLKESVDVVRETQLILGSMSSLADSVGIEIIYTPDSTRDALWLELQQGTWSSIVTNLLTNAIKYGDKRHAIDIELKIDDDSITLNVANKGDVIAADKIQRLFNRFEQLDINQQGQGLGLAIVNELAASHGGRVDASSTAERTVFSVTLPISVNTAHQISEISLDISDNTPDNVANYKAKNSNKHHLLIVEDNQELREFITSALSEQFIIAAVGHGQAAFDWLATNTLPDLILSDVMMPVMDGYQLCEKLKQDPVYQYIPLFLLTAKADSLSVKKGLALAADDYIAKPFNIDVLLTKITNQLATRDALKKHLKGVLLTTPAETTAVQPQSGADQLLVKVNALLAQYYCSADIKAADIAQKLHMSEKTLNRKLQLIAGSSISELLREYRLNQAKNLLEQGNKPKEVCFDCGFNSMSYFSRSFKEKFGHTPSKSRVI